MLSKNIFLGIISILAIVMIGSYFLYSNKKTQVINKSEHIAKISQKVKYTDYLSHIFTIPNLKCNKKETYDKISYDCKNLNKNQLKTITNAIFNKMVKIKDFSIDSNSSITNLHLEILK